MRAPLRRKSFRRLAASYAVNEMGNWMGIVALSVLVFDRTGSAFATAALFIGTTFVPAIVGPLLVVPAERPAPRVVLPAVYCGEAAIFCALALLVGSFALLPVVLLATLDGALALAGRALTRSVVAALLAPTGELRAGNAAINVAFAGAAAVGPGIAGLVVSGFDVRTALLLDAVSLLLIALLIFTAGPLPQAAPEPGGTGQRLRAGLSYIRGKAALRWLLMGEGLAFVFFAAVIPVEVIYAKQTLGAGDAGYGLLLASWGGGMVVGSLVFATLRRVSLMPLLLLSTAMVGAGYIAMGAAPTLAVGCAGAVIGGTGNGVQWVALVSAVQEITPQRMQARVMSALESIAAAMPGVGYLLGGALAAQQGPRATFYVAGGGVAFLVLLSGLRMSTFRRVAAAIRQEELDDGEQIMLELIPAQGRAGPTWRS